MPKKPKSETLNAWEAFALWCAVTEVLRNGEIADNPEAIKVLRGLEAKLNRLPRVLLLYED